MRSIVAAAACVALASAQAPSPQPSPLAKCLISQSGATYDLTGLSQEGGVQIIDNRNNDDQTPYTYYVSICNNMKPPAETSCNSTCGSDGRCTSGPAPAFQVCQDPATCGNSCYRLGDTAANAVVAPFFWNPSHGVSVGYSNGDACSINAGGTWNTRNRSISLDFICTDTSGFLPQQDAIIEDVTCRYHALIYSRSGCPLECPFALAPGKRGAGHLCAGQGVCDYDSTAQAARCFCDKGWSGFDCTQAGDKGLPPAVSYGGNIAGGFFGGVALGAVVLLLGVFIRAQMTRNTFSDALNFFNPINRAGGGGGASASYARAPAYEAGSADFAAPPPAFTTGSSYAPPEAKDGGGPLLA